MTYHQSIMQFQFQTLLPSYTVLTQMHTYFVPYELSHSKITMRYRSFAVISPSPWRRLIGWKTKQPDQATYAHGCMLRRTVLYIPSYGDVLLIMDASASFFICMNQYNVSLGFLPLGFRTAYGYTIKSCLPSITA